VRCAFLQQRLLPFATLTATLLFAACQANSAASTPSVNSISPASVNSGSSAFTLVVSGTNFSGKDVVRWNGTNRNTSYVSSTQLQAAITAADVAVSGIAQVTVRNQRGGNISNPVTFTVTTSSASSSGTGTTAALAITTTSLPNAMVATAYSAALAASGGTAPYVWKVASGSLPAGLSMASSGAITGQPTSAGASNFYAQVTDSAPSPQSATTLMAIVVAPPPLRVTTTGLSGATINVAYSATLAASGGTAPYAWSVISGQLPAGLTLTPSTGVVAGMATMSGTYPLTVQVNDSTNGAAQQALSITVAAQAASGVTRFYSDTSFWNTAIAVNPAVDPNSSAIVSKSVVAYASNANFSNTDAWGVGLAYATSTSKTYTVLCVTYCTGDTILFPVPVGALPATGSDHHLAVINGAQELDMWQAAHNLTTDTWSAGTRMVNDSQGWGASCPSGQHCNGAVAAGFALLGGAIRPEEIAQGHIDHALAITTPYTRASYIACPATHTDGKYADTTALPEGALIQLDPAFNVDAQSWPAWEKVIAKALQTYGAYVVDTGGSLSIRGVTDMNAGSATWASAGTPKGPNLSNLPWSSVRVLLIQSCN
jgi:hypothetical protein